jgi:hypothetical protein
VYAPTSSPSANFTILNKTGVIPTPGTLSTAAQRHFNMAGVTLDTGVPIKSWCTSSVWCADASSGTDFGPIQMGALYTAEIYVRGATAPVVETSRLNAPVQSPALLLGSPRHDLSANTALVTPSHDAASSAVARWSRVAGAARIESAYLYFSSGSSFVVPSASVADAFSLVPSSTSVTIGNGAAGLPAQTANDYREVGISGRMGRANYSYALAYSP